MPLSGDFSIYGTQGVNGARLAVSEINAAGGVLNGHQLELVVQDNRTQPAEAVRLSRELIQLDDVFALLGPVSSNARNAMLEVAEEFRVPMLYGIDYEGMQFSRYLFQHSAIPDHYVQPVVPYLITHFGPDFYIYGYDYIWPHKIAKSISEHAAQHNGVVVGTEFTRFGVSDYSDVLQRIDRSGAANLMLVLPGKDGFRFLQQFSDYPFKRPVKVVAFAADESYIQAVAPEHLEGVITILPFFSSVPSPTVAHYVANYYKQPGIDAPPSYASKSHYDLIYLLKQAIDRAGHLDREKVIDAMVGLNMYEGKEKVFVRPDHHFDLPMYLAEFRKGQIKVIKEFGIIRPADQRKVAVQ